MNINSRISFYKGNSWMVKKTQIFPNWPYKWVWSYSWAVSAISNLQKWFVSNLHLLIYWCEMLFPNCIFYVIFMQTWEPSFSTTYFTLKVENAYFESKPCSFHYAFFTMYFKLWRIMYFSLVSQNNVFYTKLWYVFYTNIFHVFCIFY